MNKIFYALLTAVTFASCAESYNIQGSTSVSALDGSKLYLKTMVNDELKNLDSCDVVHGKFKFAGLLDTIKMASLYMDDEPLMMPVVIEQGDIEIHIDNTNRTVSGSPLNEKLYEFMKRHDQLGNELNELEGIDENVINRQLSAEANRIAMQEDSLVTNFIVDNFDNVLGPGVFMMITGSYQYPILTPQIEDIMSKATKKFKADPYVKQYYQVANEIQARQNGLVEDVQPTPAQAQVNNETPDSTRNAR